jgi:hypothetical protein
MYATAGWDNFFVAEAGASAALLGLLFVAVSINLAKVLQYPQLPSRAAEALIALMTVLLVASACLVPGQPATALGIEIIAIGVIAWAAPTFMQVREPRQPDAQRYWLVNRVVLAQLASLPIIGAGVSLLVERGGGLYWLVPGVAFAFIEAVFGAWVLLVEINR